VEAVRAAAQSFERAHPETGLWALADFEPLEGKFPANHAAKGETSFQMVFDPEPVDLLRVPGDRAPTLDDDGVLGDDPKNATHEEGRKMVETFLEAALPRIESMLKERA
jgi:creatinine amidohydrolase/Fe(II)-dependent formamide hydrolase-like protein